MGSSFEDENNCGRNERTRCKEATMMLKTVDSSRNVLNCGVDCLLQLLASAQATTAKQCLTLNWSVQLSKLPQQSNVQLSDQ